MGNYKLVPIGPTPEMVSAAEDAYMPFGDMELAIRMAVLAAPAVQLEPVAYYSPADQYWIDNGGKVSMCGQKTETFTLPLYTAPQPTEQQIKDIASGERKQ